METTFEKTTSVVRTKATGFPDDQDRLPAGSVVDGQLLSEDLDDVADYVVIGSGAAGAPSAQYLASCGYSVIIIEAGPWVRTREFGVDVYPAMKKMFKQMGTSMAAGRAMFPVLQGSCVGGSTTINSAIAWRSPERVIDRWRVNYGIQDAITNRMLEPHYQALESELNVRSVDDGILGNHNSLFEDAATALGIKAQRIQRYDGGCDASASCLTGCRTGKKLGMNVTYVPEALHSGGKIYTGTRVESVETRYGRAIAVRAKFKNGGSLFVHARRGILVAASAVATPGILRRSGVRSAALGKHFQAHPGTSLTARFDREITMDFGATQGVNSTHFVDTDRYKIEALSLPPEILSLRIPSVGPELMRQLADYKHLLNWAIVVRAEAEGSIGTLFGEDQIHYTPTVTDMARLRKALRVVAEMMFAVGAKEIFPSSHGIPSLHSADDLHKWDDASLDPRAYTLMASHLFGSTRMGKDPSKSVVGLDFQVHGTRGLYVVDSSVFPTNLGINPQHTIMAVARLAASRIAERPLPVR